MADFSTLASTSPEFSPQNNVIDVDKSELISPGGGDDFSWLEGQGTVDEIGIVLPDIDRSSTSHDVISGASLTACSVEAFALDVINIGNANIKDTGTRNDESHDIFGIDQARTSDYVPATCGLLSWPRDHAAPDINTSASLDLATFDTTSIFEPVSLPPTAGNSFDTGSSQSPDLVPLYPDQNQWLESAYSIVDSPVPADNATLPSWQNDTSCISDAQQQTPTARGASFDSAYFSDPNPFQQHWITPTNQNYGAGLSSGLGYRAGADSSHSGSGYERITPVRSNVPIKTSKIEHGSSFSYHDSSYDLVSSLHANVSLSALTSYSGQSVLDADSYQVINNYVMHHHTVDRTPPQSLCASSNSLIPCTNGNAYESHTFDTSLFSQEAYPACPDSTTRTPGPTSFAPPGATRAKRKSAIPVCGPERPATKRLKNRKLLEASEFYSGYSCFTISPQGSSMKRSNVRRGKPRTQEEQNARDNGVCPPCRKAKLGCVPNDPNDPYGPCQRCVSKSDRAKMHLRGYYLTACHRSFADFSEILQPQLECRAIYRPLYLSCIRIRPMLDFLDHALTGKASDQLTLVTSLRTCMILATLHKFCRQTSDQVYRQFSKMAIWYWSKACENLANAYDMGMTMEDTFELLVQVAAAFANHLNERAVNQGLPRGLLNTTVLNAELARQAWSGYEARELWYLSINEKIPLRLPPGLVKAIAGGLEVLPKWLHEQEA